MSNRKNIGFREYRNVSFVKQIYGANIRNMGIISGLVFLLWVELLVSFIRTQEDPLFFIVFTIVFLALSGFWLYFVVKPYAHPVYRQVAKHFGKSPEDIKRGVAEIDMSFIDQNLSFSFNKNYFSDSWFVRRNFLFSDIRKLPCAEEMEEIEEQKEAKRLERKEHRDAKKGHKGEKAD